MSGTIILKSGIVLLFVAATLELGFFLYSFNSEGSAKQQARTIQVKLDDSLKEQALNQDAQINELCDLSKRNSGVLLEYHLRLARLERRAGLKVPKPSPPFKLTQFNCDTRKRITDKEKVIRLKKGKALEKKKQKAKDNGPRSQRIY